MYDYMALGLEIIVCPGDGGEVNTVISDTSSGVVLNTFEEVIEFLKIKFKEFNIKKKVLSIQEFKF